MPDQQSLTDVGDLQTDDNEFTADLQELYSAAETYLAALPFLGARAAVLLLSDEVRTESVEDWVRNDLRQTGWDYGQAGWDCGRRTVSS